MPDGLRTVRDYLRYAATEFTRAGLVFGHGASSALDEAAFMVLESLALPIDDVNPWLDARLTAAERDRLRRLIADRVALRKPAAYLLNKAYIQGVPFYVDERVLTPRSFIGEILGQGRLGPDGLDVLLAPVSSVLDLCTGSGCLAILAAMIYPDAAIHGADISGDALAVARRNVDDHRLADRVTLHTGDLFEPLRGLRFDLIVSNPPYVDAAAMASLPAEYRAEPQIALAGGEDGLEIVRRILRGAKAHLTPGGGLLCEIGEGRGLLEAQFDLPFLWLDTEESEGEVFWIAAKDLP